MTQLGKDGRDSADNCATPAQNRENLHSVSETVTDTASLRAWLTLIHAPGLGPVRGRALIDHFGCPRAVLDASAGQRRSLVKLPAKTEYGLQHPNLKAIEADLSWLQGQQCYLIPIVHEAYPSQLREISDPPLVLFAQGRIDLLQQPQLAMVGSRNPDHYGKALAFDFAADLAGCGLNITSGLALGIDTASHRGALHVGGDTIGVVATGLDQVYPAANTALAAQIRQQGCLVSEFPVGTRPKAHLFPRRNRIISALSLGTLVVQAALRSGSLITARLANEQGREVFAVPGSIHNPLSKGCHSLIRQGAKIVEAREQVLQELDMQLRHYINQPERFTNHVNGGIMRPMLGELRTGSDLVTTELSTLQQSVLQMLTLEPCSIDLLVERTHLNSDVVSSLLQEMEIGGHVSSHAGRYYRIQP